MTEITLRVDNISELGPRGNNNSFAMYFVFRDGTKKRLRVMDIDHFHKMREANRTPREISDVEFLTGDPQFAALLAKIECDHLELALCRMSPKKEGGQKVAFAPDAFEGGMKRAL